MSGSIHDETAALVQQAVEIYDDDPVSLAILKAYESRLSEPLRVAVAGMVKAGKSTLLNAIIGEEVAPTDTGECTRVVTWYRYGDTPRITLHPREGESVSLPVRRDHGRLVLDMGGVRAAEVKRLVVDWPTRSLRTMTLIDTPGIASLSEDVSERSTTFLTPEDAPSEADAIIYLMRHLHSSDLTFLDAFKDDVTGKSATINALAVLSRADEVGAGRIDSLLSAQEIAARYRRDETLHKLALDIVPIAGLLAQSSRSMRRSDYTALVELAGLSRTERQGLLLSADRFLRSKISVAVSEEARAILLDRFGLFGVRLALALIGGGFTDPQALAHELTRRSGLNELRALIATQFQTRATHLRARTILVGIEALLRKRPHLRANELEISLERIHASAHEFVELRLLADFRTGRVTLPKNLQAEAERLIGGQGADPRRRLGLPYDADPESLTPEAVKCLRQWRTVAEHPLMTREDAQTCHTVIRSCEAVLATVEHEHASTVEQQLNVPS